MRLKLKIPTKLTPKQKEIIAEFDKAATSTVADSSTGDASKDSASSGGTTATDCKHSFNIQQAWQRLKDFLGTTDKDAKSAGSGKDKDKSSSSSSKAAAGDESNARVEAAV